MSKKYLLWADNGESYDDKDIKLLGIFSTEKKAQQALDIAKTAIEKNYADYHTRFPNYSYPSVSAFGMALNYRTYSLYIESVDENTLIQE